MSDPDPQRAAAVENIPDASKIGNAGDMLRDAREGYGFSIEDVSQHLKLAPRQVKALEDGEFNLLPGRTFVRGFARNYARLLRLDPQMVLDALPGAAGSNAHEPPPVLAASVTMGLLPSQANGRSGALRWALPLIILVLLAAAGLYEYFRGSSNLGASATRPVAGTPAPDTVDGSAPDQSSGNNTALPNPMFPPPNAGTGNAPAQ